tara:strand:- start:113 stop:439 length:327 start_codon:yes stop_codon:yes gene_type:complete
MTLKITVEYKGQTFTKSVTGNPLLALENDLRDTGDMDDPSDIVGWIFAGPFQGKINNCAKRMARAETERLKADPAVTSMPATDDALVASAAAAAGYKNRAARDAEMDE